MQFSSPGAGSARRPQTLESTAIRRRGAALALVALLLTACGGGGSDSGSDEPRERAHWVVLGSSTAAGSGAAPGQSWGARLDAALRERGVRLDNRARSGAVTYQALPAAASRPAGRPPSDPAQDIAAALDRAPRVIILAFPSNDSAFGYAAEETAANLLQMRELARQRGVGVIVLSSQPRDDVHANVRATMLAVDAAVSAELGACFVPVRAELSDPRDHIAPAYAAGDGVHLNNAGHHLIFDRLWALIRAGQCVTPP